MILYLVYLKNTRWTVRGESNLVYLKTTRWTVRDESNLVYLKTTKWTVRGESISSIFENYKVDCER